jgi:hypothetical protein
LNDVQLLTPYQRRLVSVARFYQEQDKALPLDLTASLLAEGLSPDPFLQIDIEDYING